MAATFETQAAYFTRSIVDHEHKVIVRVASRTAKTIVTDDGKRLRVFRDFDGNEAVRPWGNYSMAPIVSADRRHFDDTRPGSVSDDDRLPGEDWSACLARLNID